MSSIWESTNAFYDSKVVSFLIQEEEQPNELSPLLSNPYHHSGDNDVSNSYDSLAQQHSDQRLLRNTETDVTFTEQPRKFIMSPVRQIFCGILILDMLITFIIWVIWFISWKVLMILLLKIF